MQYSPRFYAKALVASLKEVSPKEQGAIIKRFAKMLEQQKALGLAKQIYAAVETELAEEKKKNTARIVTVTSLSESEKKKMKEQFPAKEYEFTTNSELIGGLVVQHGTRLYQATLRKILEGLTSSI
ncbi:MAG: F0F1 ATP synthase subunit delta [Candidatus Spechtbacteria bacterium]|nr:F0F1 ATP synthase subunit delta [Candidatus Spechtbacteria bacterium]